MGLAHLIFHKKNFFANTIEPQLVFTLIFGQISQSSVANKSMQSTLSALDTPQF